MRGAIDLLAGMLASLRRMNMEQAVEIADLAGLMAPYADTKDTTPVYLRCGEEVPYGMVVKVMAALEREGFVNLSLVADPPGTRE